MCWWFPQRVSRPQGRGDEAKTAIARKPVVFLAVGVRCECPVASRLKTVTMEASGNFGNKLAWCRIRSALRKGGGLTIGVGGDAFAYSFLGRSGAD